MASITITIPDAVAPRVLDAVASRYGWAPDLGVTKAQFAKSILVNLLKESVKLHEGNIASRQATDTSNAQVDSDIVLS